MEKWLVRRFRDGRVETVEDDVVTETRVSIRIDGREITGLMALADSLDFLAAGFLLNEGYLNGPDDIDTIRIDRMNSTVDVFLKQRPATDFPVDKTPDTVTSSRGFMRSGCSNYILPYLNSTIRFSLSEVLTAIDNLSHASDLFRATGGVHSAGLWLSGKFLWIHDDVGRHNASDKVIGHAILHLWPIPEKAFLVSTGRISSDIVMKTIRARIPLLVSRSAPTGIAIRTAHEHGLTLIGFARWNQCSVYTHPERVEIQ
ncbi:formate dehydrogenase accessory sulfurtransferase FdhD [bacterium]|nr:formate dehydrogenase accessory sulfurtransferase FdhD [candidate division CSSED10-310 bacterium]